MLYTQKIGEGPNLALLHGWGSSSKIWQCNVDKLSKKYCLWCVDLPGHGNSYTVNWDYSVDQGLELLTNSLPKECAILGWSLGGLYAQLYAAKYPTRVSKLMLISSTPKFTACDDWPHGMQNEIFTQFVEGFNENPKDTLKRFCALQVVNTISAKQTLVTLVNALSNENKHIKKIAWGLSWLKKTDLRKNSTLSLMPIYILQGENDRLVSKMAMQQTASLWQRAELCVIDGAGHVPFVSNHDQFIECVVSWFD